MNEIARKQARRAELENYLLDIYYKQTGNYFGGFVQWLEVQAGSVSFFCWRDEAIDLIALYGEG